jgi:predicted metal-dependent hydrolase
MTSESTRLTRRAALAAGAVALAGGGVALAEERHPHIHAAIHELREARQYLKESPRDFGGHKARALELIDETIRHLELCLKY